MWPLDAFGGLLSQTWCYVHLAWPDVMHIWLRLELHNCTFCVFEKEEYYGAPAGGMHLSGTWSGCPDIFKSWLLHLLLFLLHHLKIIVQHHAPCADLYPCLKYNFIMLAKMELAWQALVVWWSILLNWSDGTIDSDGLGRLGWSKKRVNTVYFWSAHTISVCVT